MEDSSKNTLIELHNIMGLIVLFSIITMAFFYREGYVWQVMLYPLALFITPFLTTCYELRVKS